MGRRIRMTEGEYRDCREPYRLLYFLRSRYAYPPEQTSNRKLRLFACACCRRIWHLLPNSRSRRAVELSELFADGLATQDEVEAAGRAVVASFLRSRNIHAGRAAAEAAFGSFNSPVVIASLETAAQAAEGAAHCALLRDVYGNPFRPVTLEDSWLTWGEGTAVQLAQGIYQDRTFDRLPVLADALEEAGCTDRNILEHCRLPGLHVRGCWVVDLLLRRTARAGSWIHRLQESTTG